MAAPYYFDPVVAAVASITGLAAFILLCPRADGEEYELGAA